MLNALNAIVDFVNMLVSTVADMISYTAIFFQFIGTALVFLWDMVNLIPVEFQMFCILIITLSVIMLVIGRSNNG